MRLEKDQLVKLSPPWHTYHRKVKAMFARDPEVTVRELGKINDGEYAFMILVSNKEKAQAIKALLINPFDISATQVTSYVYGPDENVEVTPSNLDGAELIEAAFKGNPILERVQSVSHGGLFAFTYCVFKKEVIQFWNDDLSDLYGNYNGLASNIATEIFNDIGVQYCTGIE